jgi:hypothetical protein
MHGQMKSSKTIIGGKLQILNHERITLLFPSIFQTLFWRRQIVKVLSRAIRNFYDKEKARGGRVG